MFVIFAFEAQVLRVLKVNEINLLMVGFVRYNPYYRP